VNANNHHDSFADQNALLKYISPLTLTILLSALVNPQARAKINIDVHARIIPLFIFAIKFSNPYLVIFYNALVVPTHDVPININSPI